ncbi:hypothetical protein G6F24_018532 [Rhizopus arrhizus]|nr:hypothetical protein G6F24_018532 [Rhizopus arrhizus]
MRPGRQRGVADRRPGAAGRGRCAADAGVVVARAGGRSGLPARRGGQSVGRRGRFGRGGRPQPGGVRRGHGGLALGLLHQPAVGRLVALVRRRFAEGIREA